VGQRDAMDLEDLSTDVPNSEFEALRVNGEAIKPLSNETARYSRAVHNIRDNRRFTCATFFSRCCSLPCCLLTAVAFGITLVLLN